MNTKEIATTIQQQMYASVGTPVIWSWGAHKYSMVSEKTLKDFGFEGLGALCFLVDGAKFQGEVFVVLNYVDTYDIYFRKARNDGTMFVEHKIENTYCDTFASLIDEYVEKQENYRF